ncbi:MAG: hypothetical protein ACI97A_004273, partial [Planctomycetota bacterium]
ERLDRFAKLGPEHCVAITMQEFWFFAIRKCLDDLSCCPFSGGVGGDVNVLNPTAVMREHDEDVKHFECSRWDSEEVTSCADFHVVLHERPPALDWFDGAVLNHALGYGRFARFESEQGQFIRDVRCAPKRILFRHAPNQLDDIHWNWRTSWLGL